MGESALAICFNQRYCCYDGNTSVIKLYLFPFFQFHSLDLHSDSHWVEKNNKKRQEKEKDATSLSH